ncbi:hypothetical protein [Massilia sp. Se16.2.3]|uniref:hypothetical protein n=1 Tax=Massilia sp. Se16.2.3 TaxID=2709303 RepID=UPI0018615CCC|nr:hypothetical protein [Massilia sp. Se16.2.3]QNB00161.1 hypothetical protein G4G31_17265 [Massilia sp. Se16.2.3]
MPPLRTLPLAWNSQHTQLVPITSLDTPLKLPPDARNLRVSFAQGAASHFTRIADDLIDYPYGCVEQTSSRLIPLTMALQGMRGGAPEVRERLLATLQAERLRLVAMAGPDAVFGWWGNGTREGPLDDGLCLLRRLAGGAFARHRDAGRALEQCAGGLRQARPEGTPVRSRAGAVAGP